MTPFRDILKRAVEATPGAIGGAFADAEGEMVDWFAAYDAHEWACLTAHYGVVLSQLHAAFGIFHHGAPEYFMVQHQNIGVVVHMVDSGYFVLLAVRAPADVTDALTALTPAIRELRREMS